MTDLLIGIVPGALIQLLARTMRDAHLRTTVDGYDNLTTVQKLEAEMSATRDKSLPAVTRGLLLLGPVVSLLGALYLLASGMGWL